MHASSLVRRFSPVLMLLAVLGFAFDNTQRTEAGFVEQLIITGVMDGPLSGGLPKALELYAVTNIPSLDIFGLESANNGDPQNAQEYTFPSVSLNAGDFYYVTTDATAFQNWFGFAAGDVDGVVNVNGDDVILLYRSGSVVDSFGVLGTDGTGEPWEHLDGWAYRSDGNNAPAGISFAAANWRFSGVDALDGQGTAGSTNADAFPSFPVGTYQETDVAPTVVDVSPEDTATGVTAGANINIMFNEDVTVTNAAFDIDCTTTGNDLAFTLSGGDFIYTLDPDANFAFDDSCTVTVIAANVADQDGTPNNMAADFTFSFDTAPLVIANIHDIQGTTDTVNAGTYTVEAIVVGDFQGNANIDELSGFFIQEEDADVDADPLTSEGIFVYCDTCPTAVAVGNLVQVTGTASDFSGMSQISATGSGDITVISSGNILPTPATVDLPIVGDIDAAYEAVEGMLVTFTDTLTVSEYFQLSRFGEVVLYEGERPRQFTETNMPDATGLTNYLAELDSRRVILDDNANGSNVALFNNIPVYHPVPGFSNSNYFRGGDTITNLTGTLQYTFGDWHVRPVPEAFSYAFTEANPRPTRPNSVGGTLTVASFNVLNYFTTLDAGSNTCGPGNDGCRGAHSAVELQQQTDKIVAAICTIDADIVGLIEIENNATASLQALVDALNAETGCGPYSFVDAGVVGTDAIKVGFIYNSTTVSLNGSHAVLDTAAFVDPRNIGDPKNRAALAQTFTEIATSESVTIAVNHLKSKGSGCGVGDDDETTGQGNCNGTRTDAANALATWLGTDPTGTGETDIMIIGDLNAYSMEDPIVALENQGYTNLIETLAPAGTYGYLFDGQVGNLDHALASTSLSNRVTGATVWNINADEVNLLDYNDAVEDENEQSFEAKPSALPLFSPDAYRSSDHDPVIVGLNLGNLDLVEPTRIYPAADEILQPLNASTWDRFTFEHIDGVDWYRVWVGTATEVSEGVFQYGPTNLFEWYPALDWETNTGTTLDGICNAVTNVCTLPVDLWLQDGNYAWWITTWSVGQTSQDIAANWDVTYFSVDFGTPSATVTFTSPADQAQLTAAPSQIVWQRDDAALWYRLWVGQYDGTTHSNPVISSRWFFAADVCAGDMCMVSVDPNAFSDGGYRIWTEVWGPGGYLRWVDVSSSPVAFTLDTTAQASIPQVDALDTVVPRPVR